MTRLAVWPSSTNVFEPSSVYPSPDEVAVIVMPASSQRPLSSVKATGGDRLAARDARQEELFACSSPEWRMALAASTTVEKYGAASSRRPISSSTTASST
jgi:hypothetical protein